MHALFWAWWERASVFSSGNQSCTKPSRTARCWSRAASAARRRISVERVVISIWSGSTAAMVRNAITSRTPCTRRRRASACVSCVANTSRTLTMPLIFKRSHQIKLFIKFYFYLLVFFFSLFITVLSFIEKDIINGNSIQLNPLFFLFLY